MKNMAAKTSEKVPAARTSKKLEVLSGNATLDNTVKKKALRPNADSARPVAVPRWCGQFSAPNIGQIVCIDEFDRLTYKS